MLNVSLVLSGVSITLLFEGHRNGSRAAIWVQVLKGARKCKFFCGPHPVVNNVLRVERSDAESSWRLNFVSLRSRRA